MRKEFPYILFLAGVAYAQPPRIAGNWQGSLDAGPLKLRLAVHIAAGPQGALTSTLDSLDQNVLGIPVQETTFADNKLRLQIPKIHAQYEGALNEAGTEITGTFTQGGPLPLTLKRVDKIELPNRPQNPKPPYPYTAEAVSYENQNIHLAGTLTLPHGEGPFPAALMISGSGPQDRDESIMGHKPFWVIADYLTRRGIAVLRVDDRGVGESTGNSAQETLDAMAGDVLAGIEYLKSRKEIGKNRIGVIGHSEGGMVGPLAAVRSSDIAFVVMLAGPGVSFERMVDSGYSQAELLMRAAGSTEEAIAWNNAVQKMILRVLSSESGAQAIEKMRAELAKMKAALPEAQRKALENPAAEANMNRQFAMVATPEMRSILLYDPAKALSQLKVPVLALNGSKDMQISAKLNLAAIAAALAEGGNSGFTVTELPGLNHLFQKCAKCTIAEYGELEETFSPEALAVMGDWLVRHTHAQ